MKKLYYKSKKGFYWTIKHLWDHFIPHDGNNHHPHVLKHRVLAGYSVLLVLLKVLAIVMPVVLPSSSLYSSAITPENIVNLTNQTRINLGLSPLTVSDKLSQAAAAKAQDMAANKYFAHVSPTGLTPWSWMINAGYKYKYAGENLAVHFTTAEGVQEGWLASPSHRANIVNQNYTEIGIGVALGEFEGYPTTFVVQMFGTPVSTAQPVAVVTVPPSQPEPTPASVTSVPLTPEPEVAAQSQESENVTQKSILEKEFILPVIKLEPVTKTSLLPQIDESSVVIIQEQGYYDVKLRISQAESAVLYLGSEWSQLVRESVESDIWRGQINYNQNVFGQNGEQLAVIATSPEGKTERFALAWVAPNTKLQNFYTFNEGSNRYAKLFGFLTIGNLDDSVRQFYFLFMIFLAAVLLINIIVKIRIQKISVIGHTVFVLALALLLSII